MGKDTDEEEIIEAMARESAEQPLLKTCPLCGGNRLSLGYNLVNARRQGRIRGQREYYCPDCRADMAVHFAPIQRRRSTDLPVFNKPAPSMRHQCERNARCSLPNGHDPIEPGGCLLRELNGDSW